MAFLVLTAACLLASARIARRRYRTVITPLSSFFAAYFVAGVFFAFDRSTFHQFTQSGLDSHTIALYFLSFLALLVGSSLPWFETRDPTRRVVKRADKGLDLSTGGLRRLYRWSFVPVGIMATYDLMNLHAALAAYGGLFNAQGSIHNTVILQSATVSAWLSVNTVCSAVGILNFATIFTLRKKAHLSLVRALIPLLVTLGLGFATDVSNSSDGSLRLALLMCFVAAFGARLLTTGLNLKSLVAVGLLGIALAASVSTFVWSLRAPTSTASNVSGPGKFYFDLVGNLPSSGYLVDHPLPKLRFGENTFSEWYGLAKELHLSGATETNVPGTSYSVSNVAPGDYRGSTYLPYVVADFGILGLIVLGVLVGAGARVVTERAWARRRPFDVQLLALLSTGLVLSIRSPMWFGSWGFIAVFAVLWFQDRTLFTRPSVRSLSPRFSSRRTRVLSLQ